VLRARAQVRHLACAFLTAEQDRLSLWLPVLFGGGIAVYFAWPTHPAGLVVAGVAAAAGASLLAAAVFRRRLGLLGPLLALAAVCAGFTIAHWRTERVAAPVITEEIRGIAIEGTLLSKSFRAAGGYRVLIEPSVFGAFAADAMPARVRLNVRTRVADALPGDIVSVRAGVLPPPGPAAPGAFDFGRLAYFQQLGAVGYALSPLVLEAPAPDTLASRVRFAVPRLRARLTARIVQALPPPRGAVAAALITGERGGIPEEALQTLRDTGLAHLLAISGLHMALFAGTLFWLVRGLLALSPHLALTAPIKKWAAATALVGAFGYLLISGASVATQRAFVMFTLIFVAVILDRPAITLRNVALAAMIVLALTPESVMQASFQMSFAAAVALVAFYEAVRPWLSSWNAAMAPRGVAAKALVYLVGIGLTSIVASLATAPFAAYHFNRVADFALIANLAAMPIVGLVVMPAALAAFIAMPLGLEALPLWLAGQGIAAILWVAHGVASWPGAVTAIASVPPAALVAIVIGGLWLALWRSAVRWGGVIGFGIGAALALSAPYPDVVIERTAKLAAVRTASGALALSSSRAAGFSADTWLRRDGDPRTQAEAARSTTLRDDMPEGSFACDREGCIAHHAVLGLIALPRSWRALVEDCALADVIATDMYAPRSCWAPILIDRAALIARGAHAIYVDSTGTSRSPRVTIVSACDITGIRPWTRCKAH